MLRRLRIVILQACALTLMGCDSDSPSQPMGQEPDPTVWKAEAIAAHMASLEDFLAERAEEFVASLAPGAIDLGGGPTGTGALPPEFFTAAYWRDYMNSPEFAPLRGKTVDEVVDVSATVAQTKAEVGNPQTRTPFRMREGDILVYTPPKPGSPLDGWFGIYRKIGRAWLVVALD